VERLVRLAAYIQPGGVTRQVCARIPARIAHIETAEEGHAIVDDRKLLVQAPAHAGVARELEVQARVRLELELQALQPLALQRVDERVVPGQNEHLQPGRALA
jgi:hypothetical protein